MNKQQLFLNLIQKEKQFNWIIFIYFSQSIWEFAQILKNFYLLKIIIWNDKMCVIPIKIEDGIR